MNTEIITQTIKQLDQHHREKFNNKSEYERLLSRAVKLNEEVGELCEAVLDQNNEQRAEKDDIDIGSEIADVIICTLMIAETVKVDTWGEVMKKLEKISNKFNL